MNTPEKFWKRVAKGSPEGCWDWLGGTASGYGKISWQGKVVSAHRLAYTLTYGEIQQGMCVMHTCDNPRCCNPQHLTLGTVKDNNRDRRDKQRSHTDRQLTTEERELLTKLKRDGMPYCEAAAQTTWTHRALHKHWKEL